MGRLEMLKPGLKFCLVFTVSLCSTAHADFRAGIQGAVIDTNGALIPDATVTITSNETNISRSTNTSGSGVFTLAGLAPGAYTVAVEAAGFTKKILNNVRVDAEQMRSLNVQLEVGLVTESVTVSESSVPLIDTQAATIGGTLTARDVKNLPSVGRGPFHLMRLTSGVFGDETHVTSGGATAVG